MFRNLLTHAALSRGSRMRLRNVLTKPYNVCFDSRSYVCYGLYMKNYTYRVIIEPDGNEFHGYVPSLPGCHTHGTTIEETRALLRDAIGLYLEHLRTKQSHIPEERGLESFETIAVANA